jgi:hypothetical protein
MPFPFLPAHFSTLAYDGSKLDTTCALGSAFADPGLESRVLAIEEALNHHLGSDWLSGGGTIGTPAGDQCFQAEGQDFHFVGVVGKGSDRGITEGGNVFGVLSSYDSVSTGSDLLDGTFGLWGTPGQGSSYRAANSHDGGMEVRFAEPTTIKTFKAHCIKNDASTGTCYGNGDYDFQNFAVEYWNGNQWVNVYNLNAVVAGDLEVTMNTDGIKAQNWRFVQPWGSAHRSTGHPHAAEIELLSICQAPSAPTPPPAPTPTVACLASDPASFTYGGVVGSGTDRGLTTGSNVFGVLSSYDAVSTGSNIMDGITGLWGTPGQGSSYRAANGEAGGMEVRFETEKEIQRIKVHCIKNDASTAACYGNGDYDIKNMKVEYYNMAASSPGWVVAHQLSSWTEGGDWEVSLNAGVAARNWRIYADWGDAHRSTGHPHFAEIELLSVCGPTVSPTPVPPPTPALQCSVNNPASFSYEGVVGHASSRGLTTGSNVFGVLSTYDSVSTGSDIMDGITGLWGTPGQGSSYRAANNQAGGMEVRFAQPTVVQDFKAHCIKNNAQTMSCYGDGDYDIKTFRAEYWDEDAGSWVEVHSLDSVVAGNYYAQTVGAKLSKNWRFYSPWSTAHRSTGHPHFAEIELMNVCTQ